MRGFRTLAAPATVLVVAHPAHPVIRTTLQADFGLSKTLPINKHAEYGYLDSKFRLTGETGARQGGAHAKR